jgi:uncharacterized peroxidase-related enzyme
MPRLPQITTAATDDERRGLLDATERQLGRVPNLYAAMANSPAALRGYLSLRDALVHGALRVAERELLALLVAEENGCDYCVAAHTFRGAKMGMSDEELRSAGGGEHRRPHTRAVLQLAKEVLATKGRVGDEYLAEARAAGVSDEEISEVVAHVALNTLSNFFSHVAEPELDFPAVDLTPVAQ